MAELERSARPPDGAGERFAGYGVMGLPFRSGHLLAMRRFPASSVGPGYRSVWHRSPDGRWTFFQDAPADRACTRYFGAAVDEVVDAKIEIDWPASSELTITASGGGRRLDWRLSLESSFATRVMNRVGSLLPDALWRSERFMSLVATIAGPLLRAGEVRMTGRAPNGQAFIANPTLVWLIPASSASLDGDDLGELGPAPTPGRLGDFRIPQRGVFAIGRALFEPRRSAASNPFETPAPEPGSGWSTAP